MPKPKASRHQVLEAIRRICIVLLCLSLFAMALGFGVLNMKPYTEYFQGFGLSPQVAKAGAVGTWGAFQLIQSYPSFVKSFGGANYNFVCKLRLFAFGLECFIQTLIWVPGFNFFSLTLADRFMAVVTITGTTLAFAVAVELTLFYTAMWAAQAEIHGQTVNTTARGA